MMLVAVFVAGAAGATCRYLLDGAVQERWDGTFPMGTFVVNMTGALLLGFVAGYVSGHADVPAAVGVAGGSGFVGAFTTFSTLTWESLRLMREGAARYAAVNLVGSTVTGLLMAAVGMHLGSVL
jgi:CrcB protein